MGDNRELLFQLAGSQDLDAMTWPVGQPGRAQGGFIHTRPFVKAIQVPNIDGDVPGGMRGVVESPFGKPSDQRHLAAFKADADRTAGPGGLPLATAAAGFAAATGFALAEPFPAMFGTGPWFQIV